MSSNEEFDQSDIIADNKYLHHDTIANILVDIESEQLIDVLSDYIKTGNTRLLDNLIDAVALILRRDLF